MKNNPKSTAPTATRRAVARAESPLRLTVSPVAVPPAQCGPRYSREPDIRPLAGTGSGVASPQIFFVKRHAFDADHMELAGVSWPCPPRATAADVMRDTVTVVILGTTVPIDRYPHRV